MKTKTRGVFRQNGKTWEIDTKVKIGENWKHLHKTGYKMCSKSSDCVVKEKQGHPCFCCYFKLIGPYTLPFSRFFIDSSIPTILPITLKLLPLI